MDIISSLTKMFGLQRWQVENTVNLIDEGNTIAGSKVENSILADGCLIEGTVENCVLFRGVKIKKGAVVKNCVLMQDTVVEPNVELDCVVTDKNVKITAGKKLSGTESFPVYVQKKHTV